MVLVSLTLLTSSLARPAFRVGTRDTAGFQVEPTRTVRPGISPHVYRTPPPPKPAPVAAVTHVATAVQASGSAVTHPTTNWLHAEDGSLNVAVGFYWDASGQTAVPRYEAVLDMAIKDVQYYFDGHNPGVFTPLLGEGVGSYFDYWDGNGTAHRFRLVSVRSWTAANGEPPPVTPLVVAQFQTCRVPDGSVDWIYDLVAA